MLERSSSWNSYSLLWQLFKRWQRVYVYVCILFQSRNDWRCNLKIPNINHRVRYIIGRIILILYFNSVTYDTHARAHRDKCVCVKYLSLLFFFGNLNGNSWFLFTKAALKFTSRQVLCVQKSSHLWR